MCVLYPFLVPCSKAKALFLHQWRARHRIVRATTDKRMPWAGIEPTFIRCVSLQNQSRSCFSRLSKESREFAAEVSSKTMFRARGTFLRGPAFTFAASKAESFGEACKKSDSVRAARAAVFVTSASLLELKTSTQGRSTCKVSSRFALTTTSEW